MTLISSPPFRAGRFIATSGPSQFQAVEVASTLTVAGHIIDASNPVRLRSTTGMRIYSDAATLRGGLSFVSGAMTLLDDAGAEQARVKTSGGMRISGPLEALAAFTLANNAIATISGLQKGIIVITESGIGSGETGVILIGADASGTIIAQTAGAYYSITASAGGKLSVYKSGSDLKLENKLGAQATLRYHLLATG